MVKFQLFRSKVFLPTQAELYERPEPAAVLRAAVDSRPSAELRRGFDWHIGNVEPIDPDAAYFALGRTTSSIVELFDDESRNFVEQEFEISPYTHVVIDFSIQVCAIAAKAKLAPTTTGIARQLERLLNQSGEASRTRVRFEVSSINDPEDFLVQLRRAYSVSRFAVEFSRPNPWDVDADFQRPMQELLRESDGERGKTILKGKNLRSQALEELTRATAASGNDAEATLKPSQRAHPVRRRLRGNPVTIAQEDCTSAEERRTLLERLRDLYERLRARVS